jgi:hypothetical protein
MSRSSTPGHQDSAERTQKVKRERPVTFHASRITRFSALVPELHSGTQAVLGGEVSLFSGKSVKKMKKKALLKRISRERDRLLATLDVLTEEEMARPGACGEWSAKDVLAHIAAWEEECARAIGTLGKGEPWDVDYDLEAWNDQTYRQRRSLPLDQVRREFQGAHQTLLEAIGGLTEEQLAQNSDIRGWIANSTYAHYQEHLLDLMSWKDKQRSRA